MITKQTQLGIQIKCNIARLAIAISTVIVIPACSKELDAGPNNDAKQRESSEMRQENSSAESTAEPDFPMPNQANPILEPSILPPRLARIKDKLSPKLVQAFEELRSGGDPISIPLNTIDLLWLPSFDRPLSEKITEAISQGKLLPSEVNDVLNLRVSIFQKIRDDAVNSPYNEEERKALAGIYSMVVALTAGERGRGTGLPKLLLRNGNVLPPTVGDLLLLQIIDDVLAINDSGAGLEVNEVSLWRKVARSKNPIIRVIALRAFASVSNNRDADVEFYSEYVGESDPTISRMLVDQLVRRRSNEILKLLLEFRDRKQRDGDLDIAGYARSQEAVLRNALDKLPN